jgi:hypothetical protein
MIAEQARVRAIDVDVVCSSVDERRRRVESRFPDLAVTGCRRGARSSSVTTAHESRADRDRHNTIDGIAAILTAVASGRVHVLRRSSRNFHGIVEGDGDLDGLSRRNVDRLRVGRILAVHPKRGARRRRGLCVPLAGRIVGCAHKCRDSPNPCNRYQPESSVCPRLLGRERRRHRARTVRAWSKGACSLLLSLLDVVRSVPTFVARKEPTRV